MTFSGLKWSFWKFGVPSHLTLKAALTAGSDWDPILAIISYLGGRPLILGPNKTLTSKWSTIIQKLFDLSRLKFHHRGATQNFHLCYFKLVFTDYVCWSCMIFLFLFFFTLLCVYVGGWVCMTHAPQCSEQEKNTPAKQHIHLTYTCLYRNPNKCDKVFWSEGNAIFRMWGKKNKLKKIKRAYFTVRFYCKNCLKQT